MWLVDDRPSGVHVTPTQDAVEHGGEDCICGPTIEPVEGADGHIGWLITHHSLDGREAVERG